jgi:hypothetical protein
MTRVVTQYQAFGVYRDEAVTNKALQFLRLKGTAANTDTAFDLGTYAGSFWGDADATATGLEALGAIKDIQTRAQQFLSIGGLGVNGKALQDASRAGAVTAILSAASAGGAATETYVVTGLLTTDTILGVSQAVDGAGAGVGIIGYGNASGNAAANDALAVVYNADPGAGAKVKVEILRTTQTTPDAGGYQLAINATNTKLPDLTFATTDAPTAFELVLCWLLNDGEQPVFASGAA